jgi:hypothetical protein
MVRHKVRCIRMNSGTEFQSALHYQIVQATASRFGYCIKPFPEQLLLVTVPLTSQLGITEIPPF